MGPGSPDASPPAGPPSPKDGGGGPGEEEEEKKRKKKKKKKKKTKTGSARGIETMFRTSYRTHLDLSSLADNKANIMISINGIIISILVASIYPRVAENRLLLLPAAVLLLACLLSLVYAVLSARPRVTSSVVTLDDVIKDRANILFFGTFVNMEEEEYFQGMQELIRNPDRAYGNMIRDIYGLGRVLEKKYRLLRASYNVFMLGLVLGVTLFLGVLYLAGAPAGGI